MSESDDMLAAKPPRETTAENRDLRVLFHRLNNQLGIILANAELLQARVTDDIARARVAQVIDGALQAMATARELRGRAEAGRGPDEGAEPTL